MASIAGYGHSEGVSGPNDEWNVSRLIAELRVEQFDEPDDEHTQFSVGNEYWSVTVLVRGLSTFNNIDLLEGESSDPPQTMHVRNISDSELRPGLLRRPLHTTRRASPHRAVHFLNSGVCGESRVESNSSHISGDD